MDLKKFYDAANKAEGAVQTLAAQIDTLFEADKLDEALKLRPSMDKAKAEAKDAQQLYLSMQAATLPEGDPGRKFVKTGEDKEPKEAQDIRASAEYRRVWFDALKNGVTVKSIKAGQHSHERYHLLTDILSETGDGGDQGGNLLPVDFDVTIRELMRTFVDLAVPSIVNVEDVTAYSGWRAIEQGGPATPFASHTENSGITEATAPEFSQVPYTIVEYAGYIPVVTNLLSDTPAAIMAYLGRWFARKAALTDTYYIAAALTAIEGAETYETDVTDYKKALQGIKTMLNKTLDPAVSASASIICNQTGLDFLDQLEDGVGRALLQPDVTLATGFRVKGRPVVVVPDANLANFNANLRTGFWIGDGREWLTHFRRQPYAMDATTIGGDAWRYNNTEVRGIMRFDDVVFDALAMDLLDVTLPV